MLSGLGPKRVIWDARCVHVDTLGDIERFWGTWEHKKGDLGVQVWIFVNLGWFSGTNILEVYVSFCACLQVACFNAFGV